MLAFEQGGPKVDVRIWPGLAITSALQLVLTADELPGMGDDFASIARDIPSRLADSILVLVLARIPEALTDLAVKQGAIDLPPEGFLKWVEMLDESELSNNADFMRHEAAGNRHETIQSPESDQAAESPIDWLREMASNEQWAQLEQLQKNPALLKDLSIDVLRTFWTDHFQSLYAQHETDMRSATARLLGEPELQHNLAGLLSRLQRRTIELAEDWTEHHERTLLVPLPFMGPYLMSMSICEPEELAVFAFDARRTAGLQSQNASGPDISKLKALADETRLKILQFASGSERFGGEIVTYLQISQPGVSRHLRLLKASGLLAVRQEGTSKYYSVCDAELDALAEEIRAMKSDSKERTKDKTS
ncbi:MAG: ArsR family transcriptional regulator [Candidatus Atribacteria bacterium]|nr:MAG: ArsR family transcriptional regulator [Candidatus Atribacteria bacterium]